MRRFLCGLLCGALVTGGFVSAQAYVPPFRGTFDFGSFSLTKSFDWKAPQWCTPMAWSGRWTAEIEARYRTHIAFHERCILEAASKDAESASVQILADGERERAKLALEYTTMIDRERRKEQDFNDRMKYLKQ